LVCPGFSYGDLASVILVNARLEKLLEWLVGRCDPLAAITRVVVGLAVPAVFLVYGVSSMLARRAMVIARHGFAEIVGLPAVAAGFAYAAAALLLYVHVCWDDHPHLGGLRDATRQLLAVVVIVAFAVTFALALL